MTYMLNTLSAYHKFYADLIYIASNRQNYLYNKCDHSIILFIHLSSNVHKYLVKFKVGLSIKTKVVATYFYLS